MAHVLCEAVRKGDRPGFFPCERADRGADPILEVELEHCKSQG
jgi:hypothetical protein